MRQIRYIKISITNRYFKYKQLNMYITCKLGTVSTHNIVPGMRMS